MCTMCKDDDRSSLLEDVLKATEHSFDTVSASNGAVESIPMRTQNCHEQMPTQSTGRSATAYLDDFESSMLSMRRSSMTRTGDYYRDCAVILRKCIEAQCTSCERFTDGDSNELMISDDALGAIRLAVGKARLLLRKKLSKFDELVAKNLNPTPNDPCSTLVDDLTGFWDLMLIDVADVRASFERVHEFELNNWRPITEQPASVLTNGHAATSKNTESSRPATARKPVKTVTAAAIPTASQEDRRRKLQEAKEAARAKMQQDKNGVNNNDVIQNGSSFIA